MRMRTGEMESEKSSESTMCASEGFVPLWNMRSEAFVVLHGKGNTFYEQKETTLLQNC